MTEQNKPALYIDADACPVKEEALKVAYRHKLPTFLVSNQWLRMEVGPNVQKIVVSDGPDEADNWIAEQITARDIAVTADIPLAKRCLDKGAAALGPTGRPFSEDNIGMAVAMRDLKAHMRETGESRGFNPTFSKADRSRFLEILEKLVREKTQNA